MNAKCIITPFGNILIQCRNEEHLHNTLTEFESFLQENHLRLYVRIGRMNPEKCTFEFKFGAIEEEDRQKVMDFVSPPDQTEVVSKYRVCVKNGNSTRYYPTNDLNLAIILCKALRKETPSDVEVELYEYAPHEKSENWRVWKDRSGKVTDQISIRTVNGQMAITNLS